MCVRVCVCVSGVCVGLGLRLVTSVPMVVGLCHCVQDLFFFFSIFLYSHRAVCSFRAHDVIKRRFEGYWIHRRELSLEGVYIHREEWRQWGEKGGGETERGREREGERERGTERDGERERGGDGERERERERDRDRDRETERDRDRERDRQTDRQTDTDRHRQRQTEREEREREREREKTDTQTETHTEGTQRQVKSTPEAAQQETLTCSCCSSCC